VTDGTDRLMP